MKLIIVREETERGLKLTVEWNKPKIDNTRFEMVCWLVGITIFGSGLLKFFTTLFS